MKYILPVGKIEQHQLEKEQKKMPVLSDILVWFILDEKITGRFILLEELSNNQ